MPIADVLWRGPPAQARPASLEQPAGEVPGRLYRQGNVARVGLYENDMATLMYDDRPELLPLFAELGRYLSRSDVLRLIWSADH
jgi:hypothetical protein